MSPYYVGKNVGACTKDPYAKVKASLQRAASNGYSRLHFYDIQSDQRDDYDPYGHLKELQQQKASA